MLAGCWKLRGAAFRAPRAQMLGAGPQAMSVYIVEGRQRRRCARAAGTRMAHGSCWALPSFVWKRLHGPECGRSLPLLVVDDAHRHRLLGSSDVRTAAVARPSSRLAY